MKLYRYYCIMRPPMLGGIPHGGLWEVQVFSERRYNPEIDRMVWGWVEYERELTLQEVADYELIMHPREGSE